MIKIIDTYLQINSLYENRMFRREKWERYINSIYDNVAPIFIDDLNDYLDIGNYVYEKDILPIMNAVCENPALEILHASFEKVTNCLNERVVACFGHELDVDIVLYVGLCNGAGWVTNINGRDVVFLGVEKILELNWQDEDSMYGLVYHELGHIYHKQYGVFYQHGDNDSLIFVWQLFTEGIAMYFEQVLVNDLNYFHQDKNGWRNWCDKHFQQIVADFHADLPTMTRGNQRYFGDWVCYHGKGDVGYYLGAKFVQHLCGKYDLKQLIKWKKDDIYQAYLVFAEEKRIGIKG